MRLDQLKRLFEDNDYTACLQFDHSILEDAGERLEALKIIGKSYIACNQPEKAQSYFQRALAIDSQDIEITKDIGNCFIMLAKPDRAEEMYRQALYIDPAYSPALNNLAAVLVGNGRFDEAENVLVRAISAAPKMIDARNNLAKIYLSLGESRKAIRCLTEYGTDCIYNASSYACLVEAYRIENNLEAAIENGILAVNLQDDLPECHLTISKAYLSTGDLGEALEYIKTFLHLKPDDLEGMLTQCTILLRIDDIDGVLTCVDKMLTIKTDSKRPFIGLAMQLHQHRLLKHAIKAMQRAAEIKPFEASILTALGRLYIENGDENNALKAIRTSLRLDEQNSETLHAYAQIMISTGEIKEGKLLLSRLLENDKDAKKVFDLSRTDMSKAEAENLLDTISKISIHEEFSLESMLVAFSRSSAYHRLGEYTKSSEQLVAGNRIKLKCMPSNKEEITSLVHECKSMLHTGGRDQHRDATAAKNIFVVGLPRCGSTLIESILTMNKEAVSLGESYALPLAVKKWKKYSDLDKALSFEEIYRNSIQTEVSGDSIVVDKQLYNFLHAGYLLHLIKSSKVIYCKRNPLDHSLSAFRACLGEGNNFTSSLKDFASVLICVESFMTELAAQYPDRIYILDYDKLVLEPKEQLMQLVDWLEWEWSEAYLSHHRNHRIINTASMVQARNPISTRSLGGWQKYSKLLEPLKNLFLEAGILVDDQYIT